MELTTHVVDATLLRSAFIVVGFMWGGIIVQNRENGGGVKAFGLGLMVLSIALGFWAAR